MNIVTPGPGEDEPQPHIVPASSALDAVLEFAKWTLSDHRRASWVLLFMLVLLASAVLIVWLAGPAVGSLLGGGVVGGGIGAGAIVAARRLRSAAG